jgi:hypothetical protein
MADDRSNQSPMNIPVTGSQGGTPSMKLPRSDDGRIHKADGMRSNASAAHYADAMDKVMGGPGGAMPSVPLSPGK